MEHLPRCNCPFTKIVVDIGGPRIVIIYGDVLAHKNRNTI